MAKKHKVVITDTMTVQQKCNDGTVISGNFGEPVSLTMWFDQSEYNLLNREINKEKRTPEVAIMGMLSSLNISDWHKRQILKNFKTLVNVNIKF